MTPPLRFPPICKVAILALGAMYVLTPPPIHAQDVRVRLYAREAPAEMLLSAEEGLVRLYAGEHAEPFLAIDTGETIRISSDELASELRVSSNAFTMYAQSVRAEPAPGASFGLAIEHENARRYAGDLHVSPDAEHAGLQLVNAVPIEAYVASVVATEYGLPDLEGSKAMAILARTYALHATGKFGTDYQHVDDTRSQVYRGQDVITPRSRQAAERTEGEVLTWRGRLIQAVYHASSGGHTAHNESVWSGASVPYLRGKPDPYGSQSPYAEWTTRVSRPEALAELSDTFGEEIIGFLLDERSPDGRIATVSLLMQSGQRRTVRGNAFRLALIERFGARSLRSMRFETEQHGEDYVFTGQGYGHGVGLSQWGAHDMAQRGMDYTEILDFYYTGVTLSRLEDVSMPANPQTPSSPAASTEELPDAPENTWDSPKTRRVGW